MGKERRPGNPPRSVGEIRRAIASIPKEVVEQAVEEAEGELRGKSEEMKERRGREWRDPSTRFTI